MDNDMLDLVDRLCTVAGMIMEDHHLSAITTSKMDVTAKAECLADLAGERREDVALLPRKPNPERPVAPPVDPPAHHQRSWRSVAQRP